MSTNAKPLRYRYAGIVHGEDGRWTAVVPEFEDCVGLGETIEQATDAATVALRERAEAMRANGDDIPYPGDIVDVKAAYLDDDGEDGMLFRIPLVVPDGRSVRVNISTDARTLKIIDREASLRGLTRSTFLISAAIEKIEAER